MVDTALTDAEREFFKALETLGVRYLIVGLSAAVLQGADTVTADIDIWFENRLDENISRAAQSVGGVWIPGHFGMMPPMLGGDELGDRLDVVLTLDGLEPFATEHQGAKRVLVDGVRLWVLPLERIIASKRAAKRLKDHAALPALEAALAAIRNQHER